MVTYSPIYTAYSTYVISVNGDGNSANNYYNSSTALQMEKTFPYILTSDIVQKRVAEELDIKTIPGEISVRVAENTNLFSIMVTDSDAQRAYDTLQALLKGYPEISAWMASDMASEVRGPVAMMTGSSGTLVTSSSTTVIRGWLLISLVTMPENP